jgi:hypothetical protein
MSEMNPAIVAGTRIAIEILAVWHEQDQPTAYAYIDAVLNDPTGPGAPSIMVGQLNVGVALVLMLAQERGAVTPHDITMTAGEILRGRSEGAAQ